MNKLIITNTGQLFASYVAVFSLGVVSCMMFFNL
jgi:hypothetical protein